MRRMIPVLLAVMAAVSLSACAAKTVIETAIAAPTAAEASAETSADTKEEIEAVERTRAEENKTDTIKGTAMAYFAEFPDYKHMIVAPDLFKRIDTGEDMFIADIRRPGGYTQRHSRGAVSLPYGADMTDNPDKVPDDVPVCISCHMGQTSSQAVTLLSVVGEYTTNIRSGWNSGTSQTEGHKVYIDTKETAFPQDTYEVDPTALETITTYYKKAISNTISSFNFEPESLMELVDAEDEDYTILPVRQAEDYTKSHIVGAINIPLAKRMQEQFSQIPADKPVVVYYYTGQASSQATAIPRLLGYEVHSLQGGIGKEGGAGWLGSGYPVVTE